MDSDSLYRSLTLLVLIFIGSLLSGMETAYSSCNKIRLKNNAEKGDTRSQLVLKLVDNYDKTITTILILLNIIHIVTASVGAVLAINLIGDIGSLVSTFVLTILVFTFGEVMPKSIARDNADAYAKAFAPLLSLLVVLVTPFTKVLTLIGKLFRSFLGPKVKNAAMTEDELQSMIESIEEEGVLDTDQSELIQSAIDFLETSAEDILTPRVDMIALDIEWSKEKIDKLIIEEKYSRIPVYKDSIDNIIGILQTRKYLKGLYYDKSVDIEKIIDKPIFIHQSMLLNRLFEMMSAKRTHMVIVTDDYGGTAGILTIEDIMEELVGDIYDEDDIVEQLYTQIDENTFEVLGKIQMEDLFDLFNISVNDDTIDHKTLSAWTLEHLQSIPLVGDSFTDLGFLVSIKELDAMRIEKLTVTYIMEDDTLDETKEVKTARDLKEEVAL